MHNDTVPAVRTAIETLYRTESRRVLATLIRLLGDFDLAEEALQHAFAAALEQWPRDGVPGNPRASMRRRRRTQRSRAQWSTAHWRRGRCKTTGYAIAGEALQPVHTATTVRVRNGKLSVTDGPFAETKEQLAGFYLIEAADLNAAIQIAAKIPPVRIGSIEVRPIRSLQ